MRIGRGAYRQREPARWRVAILMAAGLLAAMPTSGHADSGCDIARNQLRNATAQREAADKAFARWNASHPGNSNERNPFAAVREQWQIQEADLQAVVELCNRERTQPTPAADPELQNIPSEEVRDALRKLKTTDPEEYARRLRALTPHTTNPTPTAVLPVAPVGPDAPSVAEPTQANTPSAVPPDQLPSTQPTTSTALPPEPLQSSPDPQPSPSVSPAQRTARPPFAPLPVTPLRDPGDLPPTWCVIQRMVTVIPGQSSHENSVARCDDVAGLGSDWQVVDRHLTFPEAHKRREALNGGDQPAVWCVMQRPVQGQPGNTSMEKTVIRCDNIAGAGPGWTLIDSNLTFPQATANASGRPQSAGVPRGAPPRTAAAPLPPVTLQAPGAASTPPAEANADIDPKDRITVPGVFRNPELIAQRARQACMQTAANTQCKRQYCDWIACTAKNASPGLLGAAPSAAMDETRGACAPHWQVLQNCNGGDVASPLPPPTLNMPSNVTQPRSPPAPLPPVALNTPPATPSKPLPPTTASAPANLPSHEPVPVQQVCTQTASGVKCNTTNLKPLCLNTYFRPNRKVAAIACSECPVGEDAKNPQVGTCKAWLSPTGQALCPASGVSPEACQPASCHSSGGISPEGDGLFTCTPVALPAPTSAKSAVLPVEPLPPMTGHGGAAPPPPMAPHEAAILPPVLLPPPVILVPAHHGTPASPGHGAAPQPGMSHRATPHTQPAAGHDTPHAQPATGRVTPQAVPRSHHPATGRTAALPKHSAQPRTHAAPARAAAPRVHVNRVQAAPRVHVNRAQPVHAAPAASRRRH